MRARHELSVMLGVVSGKGSTQCRISMFDVRQLKIYKCNTSTAVYISQAPAENIYSEAFPYHGPEISMWLLS